MYESFYRLSANPFRLVPDARLFFASDSHKRGLAYLRYGLHQGQGFVVVTGKPGTGKSTLVQTLFSDLTDASMVVASITSTNLGAEDILQAVGHSFDVYGEGKGKASLLIAIENFLKARARMGKRVLLIVDEAQNLPLKSLEELRMLSNFQLGDQPLLQIMLLGQQELQAMMAQPELEQLAQRVIAACHVKPLCAEETRSYIAHRLHCVGWRDDPGISGEALALIFGVSHGIPRLINIFCDRLFLAASLDERHEIDLALVQRVFAELKEESTGSFALGHGVQAAELPDLSPLPAPDLPPQAANDAIAAAEAEAHRDDLAQAVGAQMPLPTEPDHEHGHGFEPSFRGPTSPPQANVARPVPSVPPGAEAPFHGDGVDTRPAEPPVSDEPFAPAPPAAQTPMHTPGSEAIPADMGHGRNEADPGHGHGRKWALLLVVLLLVLVIANLYLFRDKITFPPQLNELISRLETQMVPAAQSPAHVPGGRPGSDMSAEQLDAPDMSLQGQPPDRSAAATASRDLGGVQMAPVFGGPAPVSQPAPEPESGSDTGSDTGPSSVPDSRPVQEEAGRSVPEGSDAVKPAISSTRPAQPEALPEPASGPSAPESGAKAPATPTPASERANESPTSVMAAPTKQAHSPPTVSPPEAGPEDPARTRPKVSPEAQSAPPAETLRRAQVGAKASSPEPEGAESEAERPAMVEAGAAVASASDRAPAPADLPPAVIPTQASTDRPTDFELTELLYDLVFYYESGDLTGLMALFAKDAAADGAEGAARIRKDYLALFNATEMRSMRVQEIKWRKQDKGAEGRAEFAVTVWRNGGEATSQQGELSLEVVRRGEDVVIQRMIHQVQ